MIRRQTDCKREVRTNMRGGNGDIVIEHFWSKDEIKGKLRLCARLVLEPGASIGSHEHQEEDEIFIVIAGAGRVTDSGDTEDVGPGDTILTGNGGSHAVECIGDQPLEMLAVIAQY